MMPAALNHTRAEPSTLFVAASLIYKKTFFFIKPVTWIESDFKALLTQRCFLLLKPFDTKSQTLAEKKTMDNVTNDCNVGLYSLALLFPCGTLRIVYLGMNQFLNLPQENV